MGADREQDVGEPGGGRQEIVLDEEQLSTNITRIKRPELYIKLASYIPDVEFVMIGWLGQHGRYNEYIRSLIKNGPANLKYLGALPLDQVNKEISSSDILYYTSTRGEGFGNSFIQAWMRGVPTIALESDPDGIIERERIGHCSRNFYQLVEHTRELMDNPMLLREMGQRAREYAVANHNREHMVSRYEALFRELHERKLACQGAGRHAEIPQRGGARRPAAEGLD